MQMNRKPIPHGGEKAENLPDNSRCARRHEPVSRVVFQKMPHGSTGDEQKGTLSANALKLRQALIASRIKSYGAVGMKYGKRLNSDNLNLPAHKTK